MKAFVTGGTGFIGSHLVDHLIKSDSYSEIRCLVRNQEKWLSGNNYIKIEGDLHDLPALNKGIDGVDVIFHLAAVVKAPGKKEFFYTNVDATENIIRIGQKKGVKNFVILSSLAAAGPSFGKPLTEDKPLMPVSTYGQSKKKMEEMIHEIAEKNHSIKIIRPPAVYGPREDQIYTYFKACAKRISPVVGDGTHPRLSMVYVDDLIQGILLAAGFTEQGVHPFFISGPEDYNWQQIRTATTKVLGKKAIPINLKPSWVKKIAGVVEQTASLFGKYPVLNREKATEMILEWTCSHKKAEQILKYHPKFSLNEGISRTIHWYKLHNWL